MENRAVKAAADDDRESSLDAHTDEATIDAESEAESVEDSSFDSANVSSNNLEENEPENDEDEDENDSTSAAEAETRPAGAPRKRWRSSSLTGSLHAEKKQRKCRTSFSKSQLDALEKEFQRSNFLSKDRLDSLQTSTGLNPVIIKNWFKNKRSRVVADHRATSGKISQPGPAGTAKQQQHVPNENVEPTKPLPPVGEGLLMPHIMSCQVQPPASMQLTILTEQTNLAKQVLVTTTNFHPGHYHHQHHQPAVLYKSLDCGVFYQPSTFNKYSTGLNITVPQPGSLFVRDENDAKSAPGGFFESAQSVKPVPKPSGLLDIVQKPVQIPIDAKLVKQEPRVQQSRSEVRVKPTREPEADESCSRCAKSSRSLCRCDVSSQALSRLYRYYAGFDALQALADHGADSLEATNHQTTRANRLCVTLSGDKTFHLL